MNVDILIQLQAKKDFIFLITFREGVTFFNDQCTFTLSLDTLWRQSWHSKLIGQSVWSLNGKTLFPIKICLLTSNLHLSDTLNHIHT